MARWLLEGTAGVSGQATGWVFRHGPHPDHIDRDGVRYGARARGLRAVLAAVADAANADGQNAHPGIEGVMRGSLYGRRQSIDLLAVLVAEGWLEVTAEGGGRGMATVYRLPMVARENGAVTSDKPEETVQSDAPNGALTLLETVRSETETVRSRVHPNGVTTEESNGRDQRAAILAAGFDEFWSVYPLRRGKGTARTAWGRAVKRAGGIGTIIDGAIAYRDDPNRRDGYTAHPTTWLNADGWEDDPLPVRDGPSPTARMKRIASRPDGLRRLAEAAGYNVDDPSDPLALPPGGTP